MDRRARIALAGAAIGIGLLFLTWYAAFHVGFVQAADERIFSGFGGLSHHPHVNSLATLIANLCDPSPYVYFAAAPVAVALYRRRPRLAIAVCGILLGANVTTHLLKPLLAEPRADSLLTGFVYAPQAGSWPSGHATASMSLTLCLVLVAPTRWRPWVAAAGAVFTVAVVYSFLTLSWHYPTDVLGGFLVATTWTLVGIAALYGDRARSRSQHRISEPARFGPRLTTHSALLPSATILAAAVVLVALAALARPGLIVSYVRLHQTFVLGAVGIAALAMVLATGVMLALRREPGEATADPID